MRRSLDQRGFTILELLVAMTVFSVMLVICSVAILGLSRQFYKGLVKSRTQAVARTISEEMANNLQFSSTPPYELVDFADPSNPVRGWCIADRRYLYVMHVALGGGTQGVLQRGGSCGDPLPHALTPAANLTELAGDNMRLAKLEIQSAIGNLWSVKVKLVHGDDEVITDPASPDARCDAAVGGSQFCAAAEYETTVVRRL